MRRVVSWATTGAQIKPEFGPVPPGVEVCRRQDATHTVFVLINHGVADAVMTTLASPMTDVLYGGRTRYIGQPRSDRKAWSRVDYGYTLMKHAHS